MGRSLTTRVGTRTGLVLGLSGVGSVGLAGLKGRPHSYERAVNLRSGERGSIERVQCISEARSEEGWTCNRRIEGGVVGLSGREVYKGLGVDILAGE